MSFVPAPSYTLSVSITNPAAVTNLQLKTNATRPVVILSVRIVPLFTLTANTWVPVQLGRIPTTFATVTALAAGDVDGHHPSFAAAGLQYGTTATGHTASGAATYTDLWHTGFNTQGGLKDLALPEERKLIAAATCFGVLCLVAPPVGAYRFEISFVEL